MWCAPPKEHLTHNALTIPFEVSEDLFQETEAKELPEYLFYLLHSSLLIQWGSLGIQEKGTHNSESGEALGTKFYKDCLEEHSWKKDQERKTNFLNPHGHQHVDGIAFINTSNNDRNVILREPKLYCLAFDLLGNV